MKKNTSPYVLKLLELYDILPFHKHPLWLGVIEHKLSFEDIIKAEGQHFLRTKEGQKLRKDAMEKCLANSPLMWESIVETYLEECTDQDGTPSHLDLIKRLIMTGGATEQDLLHLKNTPGNIAAISLYENISVRGAGCHIIGAGVVEYFYSQLCPKIFDSYTNYYKFTSFAAETYRIHGPMDAIHAERAFDIINEAIKLHGWDLIEHSVRDAFVATSLHYDGMLQAVTKEISYWNGKS
jgi:pyrroloquinoline quinone (PQQ) biosynthesis protein C